MKIICQIVLCCLFGLPFKAHAMQDTVARVKTDDILLKTYLFLVEQHKTIDSIALHYPSIGDEVIKLGFDFDYRFADAINSIYSRSKEIYNPDSLLMWRDFTLALELDSLASLQYMDSLRGRIQGNLREPCRRVLLAFEYSDNKADEFLDGFVNQKNICLNDSICISFSLPDSWEQMAIEDSSLLVGKSGSLYGSHLGLGTERTAVLINYDKHANKYASGKSKIRKAAYGKFAARIYMRYMKSKLISNKRIVTDALPGISMHSKKEIIYEGNKFYEYQIANLYAFENYYICISISKLYAHQSDFNIRWNSIEPLFELIEKSIHFSFQ